MPDAEGPSSAEVDLGFSPGFELGGEADQGVAQVLGVARSGDRGHGGDLGDARRRDEHRGASQAVPDQEAGRLALPPQEVRRRHEIVQVGGEVGLGEVPLALADAGEVEPEHRDPPLGQGAADPAGGLDVLGAGEAVGEDRVGRWERLPGFPASRRARHPCDPGNFRRSRGNGRPLSPH